MSRATYAELGDACATAHAMELIGPRWTYPILRELMMGPKRFGDLLTSVRGITPAVLTARLREMSATGLIEPLDTGTQQPLHVYGLTTWAHELAPVLNHLGRWAQSSPVRSADGGLTPDGAVQAMITMSQGLAPAQPVRLQLHLADERVRGATAHAYRVRWTRTRFAAGPGELGNPPTTVHCDSSSWAGVLFAGRPLETSGARVTGDPTAVDRLVDAFRGHSQH
jgi:DNA-binding HxlR family transcriptional regulator